MHRFRLKAGSFAETLIRSHSTKCGTGTLVIIKVLPFSKLLIEELRAVYDDPLEHLIKLFLIDSTAALYFPI